jgi:putative nucleotidyltransferase with HDIG domain
MQYEDRTLLEPPIPLETLIGQGQALPSLPEVYLRVSELIEDENASLEEIGETVQNDPAITSRLLNMVNSAYCDLPRQISSVQQAIAVLGRDRLKQLLMGSLLRGVFGAQKNPAFSIQVFWSHSIKTAIIARELARDNEAIDDPQALFTAGLLHDIGKLLMINRAPDLVMAADEYRVRNRAGELEAEQVRVGVTHVDIGAMLLRHWKLPQVLIDCAQHHHETEHDDPATHLIYLANQLSHYEPPQSDRETRTMLANIDNWGEFGARRKHIAQACRYADEMVFEVMESLGMVSFDSSQI